MNMINLPCWTEGRHLCILVLVSNRVAFCQPFSRRRWPLHHKETAVRLFIKLLTRSQLPTPRRIQERFANLHPKRWVLSTLHGIRLMFTGNISRDYFGLWPSLVPSFCSCEVNRAVGAFYRRPFKTKIITARMENYAFLPWRSAISTSYFFLQLIYLFII